VISASGAITAAVGTPVHMKDELRTGANARLQVTFRDNTLLYSPLTLLYSPLGSMRAS
jgi:hypothetical protein